MDMLTFISELFKAAIWPVTLLFIIVFLRKPIRNLVPFLQKFKFKEFELEFSRKVSELIAETKSKMPEAIANSGNDQDIDKLSQLANISPRAAILEAWLELELAAIDASKRRNIQLSSSDLRSPLSLGKALEGAGIIDGFKKEIFDKLRNLRNAAAHAYDFALDSDAAFEYSKLAQFLVEWIKKT